MPAPTNISATTAVELGPLPNSITQNVNFSGTTYTVWYKYTAQPSDNVIGIWAFGDLVTYMPTIDVYSPDGVTRFPPPPIGIQGFLSTNLPIQFPVVAGVVYYFKITSSTGNVATAVLVISGLNRANQDAPAGSLLILADDGSPTTVLSATDGSVLYFTVPTSSDYGAVLTDDTLMTPSIDGLSINVFDANYNLIRSIPNPFALAFLYVFSTNRTSHFYVGGAGSGLNHSFVGLYSKLGIASTVWDLGVTGLVGIAPNVAETILYISDSSIGGAVKRYDLVGNAFLSNLAAGVTNYKVTKDIIVLADDTILVGYARQGVDAFVRHYDTSGSILHTYPVYISDQDSSENRMSVAADNPNSFWFWSHDLGLTGLSTFSSIKVSDGSILRSFSSIEFEDGIYSGPATATPVSLFGHSFSCPLLLRTTRLSVAPTPTITPPIVPANPIVTCGDATGQEFTIYGTNFPLPPTVTCIGPTGNVIPVTVISYSSTQIVVRISLELCGTTCFTVNGSSQVCMYVAPGNYAGIYYIKPNKTNDTLYSYITGGTGSVGPITYTTIVAIPNPFIIL